MSVRIPWPWSIAVEVAKAFTDGLSLGFATLCPMDHTAVRRAQAAADALADAEAEREAWEANELFERKQADEFEELMEPYGLASQTSRVVGLQHAESDGTTEPTHQSRVICTSCGNRHRCLDIPALAGESVSVRNGSPGGAGAPGNAWALPDWVDCVAPESSRVVGLQHANAPGAVSVEPLDPSPAPGGLSSRPDPVAWAQADQIAQQLAGYAPTVIEKNQLISEAMDFTDRAAHADVPPAELAAHIKAFLEAGIEGEIDRLTEIFTTCIGERIADNLTANFRITKKP